MRGYCTGMAEAVLEFALNEVGEHVGDLRRAAREGNVVYLTDEGQRLATVMPLRSADLKQRAKSRLDGVTGTVPGFEHDVDVEASREGWAR